MSLYPVQEAALGYNGAYALAEQNGWGVEQHENQALTNLWNYYTNDLNGPRYDAGQLEQCLAQVNGWENRGDALGVESAANFFQGMVWGAENMGGVSGRNEDALENAFNRFCGQYGGANFDAWIQQRLDPVSYQAIRNQPWWKW